MNRGHGSWLVLLLGVLGVLATDALGACSDDATTSTSSSSGGGQGGGGAASGGGGSGGSDPCDANGVSKGPWVQHIDGTHARVRWEACRKDSDSKVAFSADGSHDEATADGSQQLFVVKYDHTAPLNRSAPPDVAGDYWLHEVPISKLMPGTCYHYHLVADPERAGRFCTARPTGDPLRFMAIGDTNPGLGNATKDILSHILPLNPEFVVHGGDVQYYESGLETWSSWFQIMQPMLSQGGFFPAVGNHESEVPGEYEQFTLMYFGDAGFDGDSTHYTFENAGVHFFCLDTQDSINLDSLQGTWLEKGLEDATKAPGFRFSIVYLHRPIVTCGDTDDDPQARTELEPLFVQYKVPLVLQAHMHGYERFDFGDITYVTAAGGGGLIGDPSASMSRPYCDKRVAVGAYHHGEVFDIATGELSGRAIDEKGKTRDSFTLTVP